MWGPPREWCSTASAPRYREFANRKDHPLRPPLRGVRERTVFIEHSVYRAHGGGCVAAARRRGTAAPGGGALLAGAAPPAPPPRTIR